MHNTADATERNLAALNQQLDAFDNRDDKDYFRAGALGALAAMTPEVVWRQALHVAELCHPPKAVVTGGAL